MLLLPLLAGSVFRDRTAAVGLTGVGSDAAAWGDFDNDGDPDLWDGHNIWRNDGGTFSVEVDSLGGSGGGLWGDFDNDGLLDLYAFGGTALIYLQRPESPSGWAFVLGAMTPTPMDISLGAAAADFDNDGFLDLYVAGYENPGYEADGMWFGNGDGTFSLVWTEPPGGAGWVYPGRGVTACDFDEDADMDIYVSNYRLEANYLWVNDGFGVLDDRAYPFNVACIPDGWTYSCGHTIGSAWGDLDNDGDFDLFVGNFSHPDDYQDRPMTLSNEVAFGNGFVDMSGTVDLAWQESYASPALADVDNDTDLDLYFTTVYGGDYPVLYENQGAYAFTDTTGPSGLAYIASTYQAAFADIDGDGDVDLLTGGRLFRNEGSYGGWLAVKLVANGTTSNAAAIGAQVRVVAQGVTVTRQVEAGTGEGNSNDLTLHFGLGAETDPVDVEVRWPDGFVQVVEDVEVDQLVWIDQCPDVDGDGFIDAACGGDDCDDADPAHFPGADEWCDGDDDDCDGVVDEPDAVDATTWYVDADGDGFGWIDAPVVACAVGAGEVPNADDCDDDDAAQFPGADEWCNEEDDDCDGDLDEPDAIDAQVWYADADADGFGDPATATPSCMLLLGHVGNGGDCDDADASRFPGADEWCDGADDDCDGTVDEADAVDVSTWYADADGDGFGDGAVTVEACAAPSGFLADASDCDDTDPEHHPGADEWCDGADDDCDGTVDEADAVDAATWYADADGDGFGDSGATATACSLPPGHITNDADCDDTDAAHFPGADEWCDGDDDDCDGVVDEPEALDAATWHADGDGDGFGSPWFTAEACAMPDGYTDDATDCDDADEARYPGAPETCDGVDNDCNDAIDEDACSTDRVPDTGARPASGVDPGGCACGTPGGTVAWPLLALVLPAVRRQRR